MMILMTLMAQTFAYQSVQCALTQCSGITILGIVNFVIIQMKTNPCPRCGKTNPADIHTCTPEEVMKQALAEQSQKADSNPIGYLLWETGSGWWEFVEEEPVDYYDYKAVYAHPPEPGRKPMTEEEIEDIYYSGLIFVDSYLAAFVKGFRQSEKHHGIGEDDE